MHKYSKSIFLKRSKPRKDGTLPIYLRVSLNGERDRIPLNLYCNAANWNNDKRRVKGNNKAAKAINLILSKWEKEALEIFYHAQISDKQLTKKEFRKLFLNEDYRKDFIAFMEVEIKAATDRSKGTIKAYYQALNHLKRYKTSIKFYDLNFDFIEGLERYLVSSNLDTNTRHKHHKNIKKFINLAISKGLNIDNPYNNWKIATAKTYRVHLEQSELLQLVELWQSEVLPYFLQRSLHQYLFMCATGLRISDLKQLTNKNIVNDKLVFRAVKTSNYCVKTDKPLSQFAKSFLTDVKGKLFNCYKDDQVLNRNLKTIADRIGINKNITAHTARHTFATLFLEFGGKVEVLQKLLDHSSIETTMIYVHISDNRRKEQIELFDNFMIN